MKGLLVTIGVLVAAALSLVGLGSALAANHSSSPGVKIAVASSGLGGVLVDGRGRTLYLFEKDKHGKSACTGQCASFWPPLIASGKPIATAGAKSSLLGTTTRGDGRVQVTYNHLPLYTFVKDTRKGQTNGEGVDAFGAEWYAVSAAGAKVEQRDADSSGAGAAPAPVSTPPAPGADPAPGGYGYGY
jgi:predicted lipoprotein with Yx(FWY)xxD motif